MGLPMEKKEEQRSSFITMTINNANSRAVAAGETGERMGCRDWDPGYVRWDCQALTVKYEWGPRRDCRRAELEIAEIQ